jgi:hypothetical protein
MRTRISIVLVAAALVAGCGGGVPDDAPQVVPVKGKITRKGAPLAGVSVQYSPKDVPAGGNRTSSTGATDENGEYELIFSRTQNGAVPGKHQVTLTLGDGFDDNNPTKPAPDEIVIPADQAGHEVTVPPDGLDGGEANFDLSF